MNDENRTRQDAYARLSQAKIGSMVRPTLKYLEALRKYLYEWYEQVNEAIAKMPNYEVIVGNVGTVFDGNDQEEAERAFNDYVRSSKTGRGRAGGESVVFLMNGEIVAEHEGDPEREES